MKKNINYELTRLKNISALRLLGVSNEQIAQLTGDSEATTKRYNRQLCKLLLPENPTQQAQLKADLEKAKQQVKGSVFSKKENLKKIKNQLDVVLSTNIEKHTSLIWFGNVMKDGKGDTIELGNRFISPRLPTKFGFSDTKKEAHRLKNLGLSMALMGLSHQKVNDSIEQLTGYNTQLTESFYDYHSLPDDPDISHDLLVIAPYVPAKRKQKAKKLLIEFALKHLERSESNFIYAERFNRNLVDKELQGLDQHNQHTWWMYAPNDILDWFECHEF